MVIFRRKFHQSFRRREAPAGNSPARKRGKKASIFRRREAPALPWQILYNCQRNPLRKDCVAPSALTVDSDSLFPALMGGATTSRRFAAQDLCITSGSRWIVKA